MAEVNDVIVKLDGITTDDTDDLMHNSQISSSPSSKISTSDSFPEPPPNGTPPVSTHKRQKQDSTQQTAQEKRKDELLHKETLLLASALVEDAKEGRSLEYILQGKYVRSYNLYNQRYLRWMLYVFITLDLSLALFERPAIEALSIPYWGTMLIEFLCLGFFTFRLSHAFHFQYARVFLKDTKNIMVMATIALTVIDIICYIIWDTVAPNTNPVRWSRPLRPLFIINFPDGKQIRRAFRNMRRTIPDILNILVLFLLSVLLFGLFALKLFYRRNLKYPNGTPYFTDYLDSVWDLYVLVTTANFPDVMMPAYDENAWFAIFFVVYLILCLYIFMSIVLATIYNNYKKNLKNEIKASVLLKRKRLAMAFDILKVQKGNEEVITHSRWKELMSMVLPNKSAAYTDLLMKILDYDNKNMLDMKNFLNLSDLLNVQLTEVKDRKTFLEKCIPNIYNHWFSEYFKIVVRHKFFRYFFDILIIANAVTIAADRDDADWFFLSVFTLEILCKFYVLGGKEFFQHFWNIFDLLVIGAAFIATVVEKAAGRSDEELSTMDILLVLRVMRLIKLIGGVRRFKVIIKTLINIGASIVTYGGVMFAFYYSFAIIGMEVFGGYIHSPNYDTEQTSSSSASVFCGNPKLNNTQFYKERYCNNNFNNFASALVVMFELTVVNQWHVIASGFVHVTSKAARLYFYAFHVCCVVIVLNIFTAFVLEAFILEFTLETVPKLETVIETKIKEFGLGIGMKVKSRHIQGPSGDKIELTEEEELPDMDQKAGDATDGDDNQDSDIDNLPDLSKEKGLKFHLKKQSRKKVEVLLQQMFQGELGDIENDPTDLDELDKFRKSRRLTLEEVA